MGRSRFESRSDELGMGGGGVFPKGFSTLTCTVVATNKKRTIPVIIRVSDINDNPPVFVKTPYHTSVSEGSYQTSVFEVSLTDLELQRSYQTSVLEVSLTNFERQRSYQTSVLEVSLTNFERQRSNQTSVLELTPVGTTIFQGVQAEDPDAGVNGQVDYHVVPGDGVGLGLDGGVGRDRLNVADGAGFFSINLPHQGQVTVNRSLDYEKTQRYLVTIVASVSTVFPSGSDEMI
uniref:(California timema) hypothetical protein n=1 Tax=Timema californicum TaxID=61474 RepID=A0A7R9J1A8_TIMCA|nr:unnamed protein product [Timema californicum]